MLVALGLWDAFVAQHHLEAHGNAACWGSPKLQPNDAIAHASGHGWTLDRRAFNGLLADMAIDAVDGFVPASVRSVSRKNGGWTVALGERTITARVLVDATGRNAALHRAVGNNPESLDRMVCAFARLPTQQTGPRGVVVEAVSNGWWYTAPTGPRERVVAFLSDSDICRDGALNRPADWWMALHRTTHLSAIAGGTGRPDRVMVHGAATQSTPLPGDPTLLAVGDAAACLDPASGMGIAKALRSGIFAAYAAADYLRDGDTTGLHRHASLRARDFNAYLETRAAFYAMEPRWHSEPFWARRRVAPSVPA